MKEGGGYIHVCVCNMAEKSTSGPFRIERRRRFRERPIETTANVESLRTCWNHNILFSESATSSLVVRLNHDHDGGILKETFFFRSDCTKHLFYN